MKDIVENDTPEAVNVLKEIKKACGECHQNLRVLSSRIKDSAPLANQGISFLDVKNELMASYMANLGLLMDKKTTGQSVRGDPAIDRLVEIRTVLEKMRPIEHKLRYQINKVVGTFKEGKLDPSDPRKFKANFGSFANMPSDESDDEEKDKDKEAGGKPKLYVAPKLAPVHYSDDETAVEKHEKMEKKSIRKALSSAMLKEIREQYTDAPMEISESRDVHRMKDNKRERERTEYEETNFVRMSVSKKESMAMKRIGTMSALGTLADFGGFSGMDGTVDGGPAKKKKSGSGKKKGKGGFGKKKGGGGKKFRR